MNYKDIVHALTSLGLATPREIFDFINLNKPVRPSEIGDIERILNKNEVQSFSTGEWFAKKRYTLSPKSDSLIIKPGIFLWHLKLEEMIDLAQKTNREGIAMQINESESIRELYPDNERSVIFCIESKKYLDGIIDLKRKPLIKKYRFPTVVFNTYNRNGMSEWKRACQLYSNSNDDMILLKIRGAGQ
jgi:hypothetical protein